MTLKNLRYFQRIARLGSIVDAATELEIPASSLSRAMSQLQDDVKQPLFERSGRSIKLTPQGVAYLESIETALQALDRAQAAAERAAIGTTLAFGFMHSLGTSIVATAIKTFVDRNPQTQLRLFQGATDWLLKDKLTSGYIELAMVFATTVDNRFVSRRLWSVDFVLIVPPKHRLARRESVTLDAVREESFVMLKPGFGIRYVTDQLFAEAGIKPQVLCEVEEVDTMSGLVAVGLGVALIPVYTRRFPGEPPRVRVVKPACSSQLQLISLRDRPLGTVARAFREQIIDEAASGSW